MRIHPSSKRRQINRCLGYSEIHTRVTRTRDTCMSHTCQALQEEEIGKLKRTLEDFSSRSKDQQSEIEKLSRENLEVAKKEAEMDQVLEKLRWGMKTNTLSA
jgi:hypothetical protein